MPRLKLASDCSIIAGIEWSTFLKWNPLVLSGIINADDIIKRASLKDGGRLVFLWALSIQPKTPVILVGTSNGTGHFDLVRPEYSGPVLKVVHFDRSGHFGRSDLNVPFHLTKLLFPVPLFRILLTRTITKRAMAWVGSVQPECTAPLGTWNFRNFKPEFLLNGKRLWCA